MIYIFPNFLKKGRKFEFSIIKWLIANFFTFLRPTSFICNMFLHPIYFCEKIEFFIFNSIFHDSSENYLPY